MPFCTQIQPLYPLMRSTKCQLVPNEHSYMQFASMHSHKHTLAPRRFNCAPMHLQSQNSALNGSHLPPQTLKMHSTNSNQVLYKSNVHKYTPMIQIKTYNVGMCTHAHPMLPNTSKEHQSSTCAPPNSKWLSKPQSSSKALPRLFQGSSKLLQGFQKRLQNPPKEQTCTSNTHKPSRSLLMHTSNQTSNHATRMSGPITY